MKHSATPNSDFKEQTRGQGRGGGRRQPAVRTALSAHQNVSWGSRQEFRPVGPTGSPANEARALDAFDPSPRPSVP